MLGTYSYLLGMPFSKKITRNLYELRILGSVHIRVFYTFHKDNIVLLHGFIKKTNKIPQKELLTAKNRIKSLT